MDHMNQLKIVKDCKIVKFCVSILHSVSQWYYFFHYASIRIFVADTDY